MPTSASRFVLSRAFHLLNKKKRKKEKEKEREKRDGSLPPRQLERATVVIPLSRGRILRDSLSFQSTTPLLHPCISPSPPLLPSCQSKQYPDPLCPAESSLSLKVDSRWISFSGVKRARVALLLDFPFRSRSVTPRRRHHPRPLAAALSHFLVSRWHTQPCWTSRWKQVGVR